MRFRVFSGCSPAGSEERSVALLRKCLFVILLAALLSCCCAALAEKYSQDDGSNLRGGLYEKIYKGEMVEAFNDFCFGGHKPGDIAVLYGENGGYAGYHLVYFVGEGPLYSELLARNALVEEPVNEFLAAQTEGLEPRLHFLAKLVG